MKSDKTYCGTHLINAVLEDDMKRVVLIRKILCTVLSGTLFSGCAEYQSTATDLDQGVSLPEVPPSERREELDRRVDISLKLDLGSDAVRDAQVALTDSAGSDRVAPLLDATPVVDLTLEVDFGTVEDAALQEDACVNPERCGSPSPWLNFPVPIGYGEAAIGGRGGTLCRVNNLNDRGEGSLRDCARSDEPRWVTFDIDGEIRLESPIEVGSNTTIDGRGRQIRLTQRGLMLSNVENIIIHQLTIAQGEGGDAQDAIRIINGSRDIWVDHVSLSDFPDGLIDITRGATNVTVSWCHFRDHRKVMLLGASVSDEGDRAMRVTLHHNWFERTHSRHPRARYGRFHIFNNYFDRWDSYAIGISQEAEAYIDHNVFRAGDDDEAIVTRVGEDPEPGIICTTHNLLLNGAREASEDCDGFFRPAYSYTHDDDVGVIADQIRAGAGASR